MTFDRALLLVAATSLLAACTVNKDLLGSSGDSSGTDTDAGTDATADPSDGDATDGDPTDGGAQTGSSGGSSGDDSSGGDDSTGAPVDGPALCAAQIERGGCEAIQIEDPDGLGYCVWIGWTPVTLVGDTCSFGAEQGVCAYQFAGSEGCAAIEACGQPNVAAVWKQEGDAVSLAYTSFCVAPPEGSRCSPEFPDEEVAPECACACTPGFLP